MSQTSNQVKQTKPTTIKLVLLGKLGVGKSAMTVRFLTKRYIGEYDPNIGSIYRHSINIDKETVNVEILDSGGEDCSGSKESCLLWADAFILVYAINDRDSFTQISLIQQRIEDVRNHEPPLLSLVGNKKDLDNNRQVQLNESLELANTFTSCCSVREISTSTSFEEVENVFVNLTKKVLREKRERQAINGGKKGHFNKIKGMMEKHIARKRAMSSLKETIDEYYVARSNDDLETRDRSDTCEF